MSVCFVKSLENAVMLRVCGNTALAVMPDGSVEICGVRPPYAQALCDLRNIVKAEGTASRIIALDRMGCAYTVSEDGKVAMLWRGATDIAAAGNSVFALLHDGTVVTDDTSGEYSELCQWRGIIGFAADYGCVLGITAEGNVVAVGSRAQRYGAAQQWGRISSVRMGCGMAAGITSIGRVYLCAGEVELPSVSSPVIDVAFGEELVVLLCENGETAVSGSDFMGSMSAGSWINISHIAAGGSSVFGVRKDGRVIGAGMPIWDFEPSDWRDIIAVDAGYDYFAGLRRDGTIAVSSDGGMSVARIASEYRDVKAISAGYNHLTAVHQNGTASSTEWNFSRISAVTSAASGDNYTVLLCADGRLVVENHSNLYGECEVISWRDIKAVACANNHTIGLKADGTVIAVGCNKYGQCDVDGWRDIIAVAAGIDASYGIKADGTVVAAGEGPQCDVHGWHGIRAIAAGRYYAIGIRHDGSILYAGPEGALHGIECWSDIVSAAADINAIALKQDGTVLTAEFYGELF